MSFINRINNLSLILNLVIAVGICLAINALVFGLGWDVSDTPTHEVTFAPPGWLVGAVWVFLFALIGISRGVLNKFGEKSKSAKKWLIVLLLFCFAYPIYTLGLSSEIMGLIGNLGVIALTIFIISQTWKLSKLASFLIMPIILWVSFATVIILAELGWIF